METSQPSPNPNPNALPSSRIPTDHPDDPENAGASKAPLGPTFSFAVSSAAAHTYNHTHGEEPIPAMTNASPAAAVVPRSLILRPRNPSATHSGLEIDLNSNVDSSLADGKRKPIARWSLIVAGILIALILLSFSIVQGYSYARGWLGRQSQYLSKPEDIELEPPPPAWLAAGKAGILRRVKDEAHWPSTWSVLGLDLDQIHKEFRFHCPWAEKVDRVERIYPNRIRIVLQYRQPVARYLGDHTFDESSSTSASSLTQTGLILDRHGVILPTADLDPQYRQSLIRFDTSNLNHAKLEIQPPQYPKPGTVWGHRDDNQPLSSEEKRIVDAANLAWYLREYRPDPNIKSKAPSNWLSNIVINPTYPDGIFLLLQSRTWAFWGEAINNEMPGTLSADRKRREFFRWSAERLSQSIPPQRMVYSLRTLRYQDDPDDADQDSR